MKGREKVATMARTQMGDAIVERKCYECGRTMYGRRENYTYSECGLRSVVLTDILVFHCECSAIVPEIPAPGVLHTVIALSVLKKTTLLSGEEVRFLRKVAGFSATDLARVLGMQKTTVSHWETGRKTVGKDSDRLIRLICFARILERFTGDNSGELATNISRLAKVFKSLNVTSILQHIEDRAEGSSPVRINPEAMEACDLHHHSVTVQ